MKTALLIVFGVAAVLVSCFYFVWALKLHRKGRSAKRVLSPVQRFTVGVFISVVLVFIPIYYTSYKFGDAYKILRPLLIAVHNSLRVFILDGEFDVITKALNGQPEALRVCFSLYAALLYVVAPILTFSNVLSLFKNVMGEFRYHRHKDKKYYIMSELNDKSIALAKSIYKENEEAKARRKKEKAEAAKAKKTKEEKEKEEKPQEEEKDAVIVFTDVFEKNEEDDYELLAEARDINAICLKKDITHVNILPKTGHVEIFLIGEDESENVSQAVKITNELNGKNKKQNVKVFVFSQSPGAAHIVDSVQYDNLLKTSDTKEYDGSGFKLRRVDEKRQLIWNRVPRMKLFDLAQRNHNTLSVMIAGFGSYGLEFFKTLIWFFQFEGYQLEITILDKQKEEDGKKSPAESVLDRQCPDLMKTNCLKVPGEAHYDIRIVPGVDLARSDLDDLLLYDGDDEEIMLLSDRLKRTNLALVALGDDDLNIEAAVHLRTLFDRVRGVKAGNETDWKDELVEIYSVVYDDQKSGVLHHSMEKEGQNNLLMNHKDTPYHIHFIGGMSSQFDYRNVYDSALEREAYKHHIGWAAIEKKIHDEWEEKGREDLNDHDWSYKYMEEPGALENAEKQYEKYEYYRLSSIAKELYKRQIEANAILHDQTVCLEDKKEQSCQCGNCQRRKRSEHMRWNAYTRTLGYVNRGNVRRDRALLHDNLRPWSELSELDREKD